MNKHIELIRREIQILCGNLERAKVRTGVKQEEIQNLENKIQLKTDILEVLEGKCTSDTYAVFWKIQPSDYEPHPEWVQFNGWFRNLDEAIETLERVRSNPRCAEAKIIIRSETFKDYGGADNA